MKFLVLFLIATFITFGFVKSANILAIINAPSYSHYSLGVKLLRPLAKRGHNVTMASAFSLENPPKTWNDIVFEGLGQSFKKEEKKMFFEMSKMSAFTKLLFISGFSTMSITEFMEHPSFNLILNSNVKFDVIIMEKFFNEALLGLAHHFQAPYMLLSSLGHSRWLDDITGNPGSPAYTPDLYLDYTSNMNFWQRFHNSIFYVLGKTIENYYVLPKHQEIMKKYIPNSPSLKDLLTNASIVFLNTHPAVKYAAPSVPNMIEIGGFHISPPKKLPEDLQKFLDSAKDGAIYFSLGSNVKSKDLSEETRDALLRVFSKLKEKVLWKFEEDPTFTVPSNVKFAKWLPQQDILAHPNVKVFITHGGLLSTLEGVYYGVPLLSLPIFAEQAMNAAESEEYGYGLQLPFNEFSEEPFQKLLHEVKDNPKYKKNAQERSKVFRDQETTPIEKAIFWVEYVIRNKGAPYLKSVTLKLKCYQAILLDVIALAIVILFVIYFVLKSVLAFFCGTKKKVSVSHKKKTKLS